MAAKKTGLGRGLDSLFGDAALVAPEPVPVEKPKKAEAPAKKTKEEKPAENSVVYLNVNDIKPNSSQPRRVFDEDKLQDLSNSIKENGLIQPIIVRPAAKGYELVSGERRWRATRLAGLKEIPAIIKDIDDKTNALFALIENMQREDLNAIEEADGIKEIMEKYSFTQEETAKVIGKSRPYVANALRLIKLPQEVKDLVEEGKLSAGSARAIAGLEGTDEQKEAAEKAAAEGWSVRQIENYTKTSGKKKARPAKKKPNTKDAQIKAVEENLSEKIGTKVAINGSEKRGKIELEYYSKDELERLVELLQK